MCAYKLNVSKAYDCVNWDFLEKVPSKLGFRRQWAQWVMSCDTTLRYAVCLNGFLRTPFN
jgi:hypothetical protein